MYVAFSAIRVLRAARFPRRYAREMLRACTGSE